MGEEKSVAFFEHFRQIAKRKQASGCPSCKMEGRMLEEQINEMEADHERQKTTPTDKG